jgi:tetratricopeptide (TPR) repeat protein
MPHQHLTSSSSGLARGTHSRQLRRLLDELRREHGHVDIGSDDKRRNYQRLVHNIQTMVEKLIPANARVLVVSKGDRDLLRLGARTAMHFPQSPDGNYSGYHPATSEEAIRQLEQLRKKGAEYLLFPATSLWWLSFYDDFQKHLAGNYRRILFRADVAAVYSMREPPTPDSEPAETQPVTEESEVDEKADELEGAGDGADDLELRLEVVQALRNVGRHEEAHQHLSHALAADRDNPVLLATMAMLEHSRGNAQLAEQYANQALTAGTNQPRALLLLANLACEQKRPHVAEQRLRELLRQYPDESEAICMLASSHCQRLEQDPGESSAHADLLRMLEQNGKSISGEIYLRAAEILGKRKYLTEGIKYLREGILRSDFAAPEMRALVIHLLGAGLPPAVIPFNDLRSLSDLLLVRGNAYSATREEFNQRACYELALRADPGNGAAAMNLAFQSMADGEVSTALEQLAGTARIYTDQASQILWPTHRGIPWPHAPLMEAAVFAELPADEPWPKITVITPSFNQAAYVEETLLSVLNQQYPNLEYIVVDGCSTDGSQDILRRYESRLSKLIIEPDGGQTEALNKGLRQATGDLILWINSDDLLAPGCLFMAAAVYLADDADIIAGYCMEHAERRFGMVNLPAATQQTFNLSCLGDLFGHWLKGHFFYQPEVVFSRRIFEKTGAKLDEKLYFAMDYEFWCRCAAAGARLSTVRWPIGLFRKHEQQKTASLDRCIIEQGSVRDRFAQVGPGFVRRREIQDKLRRSLSKRTPHVAVLSTRASKIFSPGTAQELMEDLAGDGSHVSFHERGETIDARDVDLLIVLIHLYREHEAIHQLRSRGFKGPVIGWFWDNHHHVFDNFKSCAELDVAIPGHAFAADYLRNERSLLVDPIPLCVTQWTKGQASRFFAAYGNKDRSNDLYGGFVRYQSAAKRNRLIQQLLDARLPGVFFLEEDQLERYFGLSLEQRFAQWCGHKVSLCLPLSGDLSQRLFDGLLTGQVPVVPLDIHDLDSVIPPELQQALPVVRFDRYEPDAVMEAHQQALRRYDEAGAAGVQRRHDFALSQHMFLSRAGTLIRRLRGLRAD